MTRKIDYGNLMHRAMRSLIQNVLTDIAKNGLPGEHHFFITFNTMHPDVEIADWLSDRYPDEMTVVIQHWFDNLNVTDEGFSITLNFGENPEPLYIPYDAIQTFVDPSVEFGLRFETQEETETKPDILSEVTEIAPAATAAETEAPMEEMAEAPDEAEPVRKEAEVVSLDQFRKN